MRIRNYLEIMAAMPLLLCIVHWFYAVLMTMLRGRARKCPKCSSRSRWAKVRLYDRYLPAFVMPRRCESCQKRFYTAYSVNYAQRARDAAAARAAQATRPSPARANGFAAAAMQGNLR